VDNGEYVIYVRAYDGEEYATIKTIEITVDNEKDAEGISEFMLVLLIGILVAIVIILVIVVVILIRRKKQP